MDSLLPFVLELYRLAQSTPVAEFPDLALQMVKAIVDFRSATWSDAEVNGNASPRIYCVRMHNEPEEVRLKLSLLNQRHTRRLIDAVRRPGRASVIEDSAAYFDGRDEAPMRAYVRTYGHDRNLLITDRKQWLSLYRPIGDGAFSVRDAALVEQLMPHLAESIRINQSCSLSHGPDGRQLAHQPARALVDSRGVFLYCRPLFLELLRTEWPDWSEPRIPKALLTRLGRDRRLELANGRVELRAHALAEATLLTACRVSPIARLSPRELAVAREYGGGKSHKEIALVLRLAPSTVRNVLQRTYRKLEIDNKAALARLLAMEST